MKESLFKKGKSSQSIKNSCFYGWLVGYCFLLSESKEVLNQRKKLKLRNGFFCFKILFFKLFLKKIER